MAIRMCTCPLQTLPPPGISACDCGLSRADSSIRSCLFYGDLYPNKEGYNANTARNIYLLIEARKKFAYGSTKDYFLDKNCIGFVRKGDASHLGCAVILSNREEG